MVKSIKGTRSYIIVEFEDKGVKIQGELTSTSAFYAEIGSIKNWEEPYQHLEVTNKEKEDIVDQILQYQESLLKKNNTLSVKVIFDY